MEIVDAALSAMLADVRERRNNLGLDAECVGVHSLPEEILCMVFECLVDLGDKPRSEASAKAMCSLLRVCRRWRRVASAKASIWRGVDFDIIPPAFLDAWLGRCAATPLVISTSHADTIISIRDKFQSFPSQVVGLTLRDNWYMSSTHRELVNSSTFPNVVYLRIADYPSPDIIFDTPSIFEFSNLHTLDVDCDHDFWVSDHSLPVGIEDLTIHMVRNETLSLSRLARAIGSLRLLRRLVFKTGSSFAQDSKQRMRLPALEYVRIILNPHYHHLVLDILPTFQDRAYHLIIREKEGPLQSTSSKEVASSIGAILKGHTHLFTAVRFALGLKLPVMSFEGVDHFSVSIEEHDPFGKRFALVLKLLDLQYIREAVLAEEPGCNDRFYDIGDAYRTLRSVERLIIEGGVGPEASRLLIGLGGDGRRFIFPHESPYVINWPSLSFIHLHNVDTSLFYSSNFDDIRGLGLALWSIRRSGVLLQTFKITKTFRRHRDFSSLETFIPTVLVESTDELSELEVRSYFT